MLKIWTRWYICSGPRTVPSSEFTAGYISRYTPDEDRGAQRTEFCCNNKTDNDSSPNVNSVSNHNCSYLLFGLKLRGDVWDHLFSKYVTVLGKRNSFDKDLNLACQVQFTQSVHSGKLTRDVKQHFGKKEISFFLNFTLLRHHNIY